MNHEFHPKSFKFDEKAAPTWGAALHPFHHTYGFQSALPRGERHRPLCGHAPRLCFNPLSRVGSDTFCKDIQPKIDRLNSRCISMKLQN